MQTQPNFEFIKTKIYQRFINSDEVFSALALSSIQGNFKPFYKKHEEFKKDFNQWLDRLDIRSVSQLIDKLTELKISLPSWMRNKNFVIDYNEYDALDLIKN